VMARTVNIIILVMLIITRSDQKSQISKRIVLSFGEYTELNTTVFF